MASPLIQLNQSQEDLIKQGHMAESGKYYFLPFYFEKASDNHLKGVYKMKFISEDMPEEFQREILKLLNVK